MIKLAKEMLPKNNNFANMWQVHWIGLATNEMYCVEVFSVTGMENIYAIWIQQCTKNASEKIKMFDKVSGACQLFGSNDVFAFKTTNIKNVITKALPGANIRWKC